MASQYTYLVGLLIFGVILGTVGLVAAERERRRLRHKQLTPQGGPRARTSAAAAARASAPADKLHPSALRNPSTLRLSRSLAIR